MAVLNLIALTLQEIPLQIQDHSTGREWLVYASFIIPIILLLILLYIGNKRTV